MSAAPRSTARSVDEEPATAAPRVKGRLAPEAMFPAGISGYRARRERLGTGERVRVVEIGPEDGSPVVFIPGWSCSAWDFNKTLGPVAAAGFRAIAIDPRGHGLSDMPRGDALYTTDALVGHLSATLDVLGLARASIVGHSMGGALAVHLALRESRRVTAVVLLSAVGLGAVPPAAFGRALSARWLDSVSRMALRRWVVAVGLNLVYGPHTRVDARNVDEYWAPSQFEGFVPAMRAALHGFRWTPFSREELARVTPPTLVIRGGHDGVVRAPHPPMELPATFREMMVAEAGHLPHDEAPARVNAAIVDFLREHAAAREGWA